MVNGINTGYNYYQPQELTQRYNGYNVNSFNTGSVAVPNQFATQPVMQPTVQPEVKDNVADGKDDGHIGFWKAAGNVVKGVGNFFKGLVFDENGKFDPSKLLEIAGVTALTLVTFGTAGVAALAVAGVVVSGAGLGKAMYNAATAKTDAECEQAFQSIGSNGVAFGLALAGAKGVAKSNAGVRAGYAENAEAYNGLRGTVKAVGDTMKDATSPVKGAVSGAKDAYIEGGVRGVGSQIKDNVVSQAKSFGTKVKGNVSKNVYGTKGKIAESVDDVQKKINKNNEKMSKIDNHDSLRYRRLEAENKTLETRKATIEEMNGKNTWKEGNEYISQKETDLAKAKENLKNATTDADKAKYRAEVQELRTQVNTGKEVLSRRTQEAQFINHRIEVKQKALADATAPKVQAQLRDEIKALQDRQNFELPTNEQVATAKQNVETARADREALDRNYPDATATQKKVWDDKIADAQKTYDQLNGVATGKGYKFIPSEMYKATDAALRKGIINGKKNNTARWLTVGIAGRQFGTSSDYSFYSQLTPEQQQQFNALPEEAQAQLIAQYQAA